MGAHRLIPLFFFGSPDSRLRSLLVAWKKSLTLDYGVLGYSLGSSDSATPRLLIQSGLGGCESRSKVNPGSPLGQPWVPDFWVIRGSPQKIRQLWVQVALW